jgi:hypothetical protein
LLYGEWHGSRSAFTDKTPAPMYRHGLSKDLSPARESRFLPFQSGSQRQVNIGLILAPEVVSKLWLSFQLLSICLLWVLGVLGWRGAVDHHESCGSYLSRTIGHLTAYIGHRGCHLCIVPREGTQQKTGIISSSPVHGACIIQHHFCLLCVD